MRPDHDGLRRVCFLSFVHEAHLKRWAHSVGSGAARSWYG